MTFFTFVFFFFSQYACAFNKTWRLLGGMFGQFATLVVLLFYDARGPDLQLRSVLMKMLAIENIAIWRGIVN